MHYLIVPLLAWAFAQVLKHVFRIAGRNQRVFLGNPRFPLMVSGGMPSAHAATMTALATIIALIDGVYTVQFAISVWLAIIVIYDAIMVRYSSGKQGDTLNQLLDEKKSKLSRIRVAHGHTPLEVLAGAVLGVAMAVVVFFATK